MTEKQKKSFDSFHKFFDSLSEGKNCTLQGKGNSIYQYVSSGNTSNNRCCQQKSQWGSANNDIDIMFSLEYAGDYCVLKLPNSICDDIPTVFSTADNLFFVEDNEKRLYILGADEEKHTGAKFYELYLYNCKAVKIR